MKALDHRVEFQKILEHLKGELSNLRTGRASPALVDELPVEAYDGVMALKSLASISIPDNRTLVIEPWDKSVLKAIEKAITVAGIGITPVVDGNMIRLALPKLTEENRKELVKIMQRKLEEARVSARGVRERARMLVIEAEREKNVSEDERYRFQEDLEKLTRQFIDEIDKMGEEKEVEIMTV